jgi:trimeric autotransporter adhesin
MSTKTLRKRIALVAVSALTAGLVSVVAAPSANAAHGDISNTFASGTVGVVSSAMTSATTTKTAVLLSTGQLVLTLDGATSGDALYTAVSAGGIITAASAGTISNDQASHTEAASATSTYTITVKPTGAIGSTFTVSTYATEASATVINKVTVTIAGSSLSGTVVPANSYVNWTTNGSTTSTVEDSSKASGTTGNALYIYVQLRDAYKANVTSTSGALIATASAGAVVKIGGSGLNTTGTAATAVSADSPAALYISVAEATAGAGWNGTVTVSYNGTTIATKAGKISGAVSKLTVTAKKIGKNDGSANAAALEYQATDAAGNNVVVPFADIVYSSSTNPALVSAAAGSVINSTSAAGNATFTCANSTSLTGKADIVLQTTLADGTVIKSNAVTVQCGGAASTYTAAFDKAKYLQGEIATMTISFLDVRGAVANSYDAVANATPDQAITANQMERVTAHAASAKPDGNGQIKYTFTVGTSSGAIAGAYNAVVSLPTLNAVSGTKATNQTVAYTIEGAAGVTMADVLKSIVSLIASINKQIAALQKALLKR